MELMMKN